jgi:Ig-like domain-containing protein
MPPLQRKRNRMLRLLYGLAVCLILHATTLRAINFNVPLLSLTNHNTSANPAYNAFNFSQNFGPTSWVSQSGATIPVDTNKLDQSLNPVTPGHVSKTDVHTLIPKRPDLRWFAHATPWFGPNNHINIGLNNNTDAYVAAMITDMKNRGFNGVVINWYGKTHQSDNVTLKIKSYLASQPANNFTYILMLDKGTLGGLGTSNLEYQIHYCQTNYFNDPNYEHEPVSIGQPILMFFGVRSVVGAAGMATIKSDLGGNMVWVEQGTSYLSESWEDESFQWTDNFDNGINPADPFNLSAVTSQFTTIKNSGKKAFGAMCSQFNGTLTKSVGWSLGKYLPCSNGICEVQRALVINASIPTNMTRMQWATWSDWEEGTQVEGGIENNFSVTAQMNTNVLSWTITSGDERTVDHYEIYAASNSVNAAFLGSVISGSHKTNLTQAGLAPGTYQFYVDAIGKPCIRDHLSQPVSAFISTAPTIIQQPTNVTVAYNGTATFSVTATGPTPFTYTWFDQSNSVVSTNSTLVISNATQNNSYYAAITNQFGGIASSTATLTVLSPNVNLHYQAGTGQLVLTWSTGILQSAPAVDGPYTDVLDATSPYIIAPSEAQQYFRVRIPSSGP